MKEFTRIVTLTALISLGVLSGNINAWAETPAPAFNSVPVNAATTSNPDLAIVDYVLVEKKRVSRTDFNYTYRASIINSGAAIQNAAATLSGSSGVTTVVDGTLTFGFLGQGTTVSSTDTFTIRQNRRHPFNPQTLSWMVDYDSCAYPELLTPELVAPLLGGNSAAIPLPVCYSGLQTLTFHLIEGPLGMSIDPVTGVITWTPPLSLAGQQAIVKATVTDGTTVSQVEFGLPVASETPIEISTTANQVTVTEPGNLQGLSFILPTEVSESINVSVLNENQVPPLPEGVQRLTDIFRTSPAQSNGDPIKVKLPAVDLPDGRFPFELILFVYTEVHANTASDDRTWVPTQSHITMNADGTATIDLWGVGEASYIGLRDQDSSSSTTPALLETASFDNISVNVTCEAKVYPVPIIIPGLPIIIKQIAYDNHQICTVPGDPDFEVLVKDFKRNQWDPATTIGELVGWIYQAQAKLDELGLEYDVNDFEIVVQKMKYAGYATDSILENWDVIHLSEDNKYSKAYMQGTAVHEYFHQAQARTTVPGKTNIWDYSTDDKSLKWLTEGTARWFEDEVFDDLEPDNTYILKETSPLPKILEKGFDAYQSGGLTSGYARFGMWKLISQKCSGFSLKEILNFDSSLFGSSEDIINLSSKLKEWNCRFTTGFGEENVSTLAGALLHYQYATVKKDDIELLDGDEDNTKFHFDTVTAGFIPKIGTQGPFSYGIPANGARSIILEEVPVIDAEQEAFIRVQTSGGNALVSLIDYEFDIADWIEVPAQTEYGYGHDGTAPKLFVTVVNPSTTDPIDVSFEVGIRNIIVDNGVVQPVFLEGDPGTVGDGQLIDGTSYAIGFLRSATSFNPDPYPFLSDGADTITLTAYGEAPVLGYESYIFFGMQGDQCNFVSRTINTRVTELGLTEPANVLGVYGEIDVQGLLADFSAQGCNGSAADLYVRQVHISAFFGGEMRLDAFAIGDGALKVLTYVP